MKRWVTQFAFATGLALTLGAAFLAVRGFWILDQFDADRAWDEPGGVVVSEVVRLRTDWRAFTLTRTRWPANAGGDNRPYGWRVSHAALRSEDPRWRRLGFWWEGDLPIGSGQYARGAGVPSWFAVGACAACTVLLARPVWCDRRRRARLRRGLCPACGYDLRGAAHERCPECGAAVEDAAPAAV